MEGILRYEKFNSFKECIHGTSTKNSLFPFGFSLALHTGEDADSIVCNRKKFLDMIGAASKDINIILANQTHSDNIVIIDGKQTAGWLSHDNAIADCDALITAQ